MTQFQSDYEGLNRIVNEAKPETILESYRNVAHYMSGFLSGEVTPKEKITFEIALDEIRRRTAS